MMASLTPSTLYLPLPLQFLKKFRNPTIDHNPCRTRRRSWKREQAAACYQVLIVLCTCTILLYCCLLVWHNYSRLLCQARLVWPGPDRECLESQLCAYPQATSQRTSHVRCLSPRASYSPIVVVGRECLPLNLGCLVLVTCLFLEKDMALHKVCKS